MNQVKMSNLYQQNSNVQSSMTLLNFQQIEKQIQDYIIKNPYKFQGKNTLPFVIADLGCANGKNSIPIFKNIITSVRAKYPHIGFLIYLVDTPANDSNLALLTVAQGLEQYDDINIYYQGKSFYQSLFPKNYVDVCFCFSSIHWYSKKYNHTSQNLWCFLTEESPKNENFHQMEKIADQEWAKFLFQRQRELKVGGKLIVGTLTTNEKLSENDKSFIYQYSVVNKCLNQTLSKFDLSNLINKINLNTVVRQKKHYLKYFQSQPQKTKMKILNYRVYQFRSELWDPLVAKDNLKEYSKKYSKWVAAYASQVIKEKIKLSGVNEQISKAIIDQFFDNDLPNTYIKEINNFTGVVSGILMCIQKSYQTQ